LETSPSEPLVEDYSPRSSRNHSGEEKRVRFQNVEITDQKNVVVVKANEVGFHDSRFPLKHSGPTFDAVNI
jgi:hypothetical protein